MYLSYICMLISPRPLLIISFIFIILDFLSLFFWRNYFDARLPGFHIQSKVRKVVEVHGSVYCRSFPLKISSEAFKSIFFYFPFQLCNSSSTVVKKKIEPHPGCVK